MKKEKVEHRIGDIVVAEFIKNHREGRKPVCMIDGIICFIDRRYRGQFVHEHSVWHVEVMEIKDKVMVVNPVQEIKTAIENQREMKQKMKELQTNHKPKHTIKKAFYPYKSQQERLIEKRVKEREALFEGIPIPMECEDCRWEGYDDEMKKGVCPKCGSTNIF